LSREVIKRVVFIVAKLLIGS